MVCLCTIRERNQKERNQKKRNQRKRIRVGETNPINWTASVCGISKERTQFWSSERSVGEHTAISTTAVACRRTVYSAALSISLGRPNTSTGAQTAVYMHLLLVFSQALLASFSLSLSLWLPSKRAFSPINSFLSFSLSLSLPISLSTSLQSGETSSVIAPEAQMRL